MPREIKLTIEQIQDFLDLTANESNETIQAIRSFLKSELTRRKYAGNTGGRKSIYIGNSKERNQQAAAKYRENKRKA